MQTQKFPLCDSRHSSSEGFSLSLIIKSYNYKMLIFYLMKNFTLKLYYNYHKNGGISIV